MGSPEATGAGLDADIRRVIYDAFISDCASASVAQVARKLGVPVAAIKASYARLAEAHMLVLQHDSGEVLMANPFSAVPTAFRVEAAGKAWWGNCIWDALGVAAMTGTDCKILASCPDCGEAMSLAVERSQLLPAEGIVHFAVPAAHWWDDLVFT